jgi:hypothetical protein
MQRSLKSVLFLLLFSAAYIGCESGSGFYEEYTKEDLFRLPLVRPYELLNLYGADSSDLELHGWTLKLQNQFFGYVSQLNVSDINVLNGTIYGHGKDGLTHNPNFWFAIVPDQKIEKVFETENEWTAFLKERKVDPAALYKVWPVFYKFRKDVSLPWKPDTK